MAGLVELKFHPERRTLRQFGLIAFVGFGLLALAVWREKAVLGFGLGAAWLPMVVLLVAVSVVSAAGSIVYPEANRPLYILLSTLSFPLGYVSSFIIMGVLFYLVFGIVAVIIRLRGHDPMDRSYNHDAESYWITVERTRDNAGYFRQS